MICSETCFPTPLRRTIEWFRDYFSFDTEMHRQAETRWRLKHPGEMLETRKGICHDLVAFQSQYLKGFGYEANHLMFYVNRNRSEMKFHHSLICLWYDYHYYILEPCADYADNGCYGPYSDLEEYEAALMYYHEKNASPDYEWFKFFREPNYQYGMNLQEYIASWRA